MADAANPGKPADPVQGTGDGVADGAAAPAADLTPAHVAAEHGREAELVGRTFDDKFLILRLIGIGGFGAVYAARDLQLECGVAIKILHPDVAGDEQTIGSFLAEARRLTRLKHPNVVGWKALTQTADGTAYFVMELLEGSDLLDLLEREKTLPPMRAARILLQILDALRAAHRLPDGECLLHLDLKPSNVFLEPHPSGRRDLDWVKVIDFGISQFLGSEVEAAPGAAPAADGDARPTEPGRTIVRRVVDAAGATRANAAGGGRRVAACTPEYAAPEQGAHLLADVEAVALDERADLYAVGVIAYRMVTGRLPFDECKSQDELLRAKLSRDAPAVETLAPRIPRRLARFIHRCLQRDRSARYASATAAYAELDALVHPRVTKKAVALGASLAALMALSGWLLKPVAELPRLDLYETRQDRERLLPAGDPLHFGVARSSCRLRVAGVELAPGDSLRLVAEPGADAAVLDGFSVRFAGDAQVELRADIRRERTRQSAYVEVLGAAPTAVRRYSQPFEVVWIPAEALQLGRVDVVGRGARRVDPQGQQLAIAITGRREDIERVFVEISGRTVDAEPDAAGSDPLHADYVVPLQGVATADGPVDLAVRLVDRSGSERRAQATLDFVTAPLAFARPAELTAAERVGPRWFVSDPGRSRVSFALNGVADVEAVVLDEAGRPLGRRSLANVAAGEFALADFDLGRGDREFSGSLELVADDGAHVLRGDAAARGKTTTRVELFSAPTPRIDVELSRAGGARSRPLVPGETIYTNSPRLEVHVTREGAVPVRVVVHEVGEGADAAAAAAAGQEKRLVATSERQADFDVELAGAGRHELAIRCWRCVDDDDRKRTPDLELRAICVVDESAPLLGIEPESMTDAGPDATGGGVWPAAARLRVADRIVDGGDGDAASAIHVKFSLASEARPTQPLFEGELPIPAHDGDTLDLALPFPIAAASATPALADGRYRLRVDATDEAGNAANPALLELEIARSGPTFELKRPVPGTVWKPDADGSYEIRAIAEDLNGVAAATARLTVADLPAIEVVLVAESVLRNGTYVEWSGHARVPRSWTRREIELECTTRDARGCATSLDARREAGSIERSSPACVHVSRGGFGLGQMRLLRGNHDAPYVFGGQSDDTEEKLFEAAGLGTYKHLRGRKSWEVRFAPDEIADYYLDEREVTVAEFHRFLDDPCGYADASVWVEGVRPDEARRSELAAALAEAPADEPVVNVTWDEASAFARWSGKRLPSFVEWEYALRGGPLYRASSSGGPIEIVKRSRASGLGNDLTPDTRIWNLTGNVAEWSATAAGTPDERDAGSPARFAAAHPQAFLRAATGADLATAPSFWVVGASFRHARAEFSVADERARGWRGPDVGFRCAAALDDVVKVLEVADPSRPVFTEGPAE